jgi:hypothetical protein
MYKLHVSQGTQHCQICNPRWRWSIGLKQHMCAVRLPCRHQHWRRRALLAACTIQNTSWLTFSACAQIGLEPKNKQNPSLQCRQFTPSQRCVAKTGGCRGPRLHPTVAKDSSHHPNSEEDLVNLLFLLERFAAPGTILELDKAGLQACIMEDMTTWC